MNIKTISLGLMLVVGVLSLTACSSPEDKAKGYLESGMSLLEKKEFGKANIEFRNALQLDRTLNAAIWGQALVAEKQGKHLQTYKLLNAVLLNEPEHLEALVKIGRILLVADQIDKALEKSDAAFKLAPNDSAVLAFRASVLFKLNDSAGAVKLAKQVIAKEPTYVDALIVLAIERLAAKDSKQAIAYLDQGLKGDDKNVVLQLVKIKALDDLAELDLAEDVFKRLIGYYPEVPAFNYALAQFYLKHDRKGDAEVEFRRVVENKPDDLSAKIKLVQLLNFTQGADAAKEQLVDFVTKEPNNYDLKFTLAQFYISNKKIDLANKTIDEIAASATDNDVVVKALGVKASLLLALAKKDEAGRVVKDILAKDERNENGLILKSSMNIDGQDYDTAISDLRVVLRDSPNSSRALFLLAKAHLLSGSPELADEQYLKAFKASKFNAGYGMTYAQFLLKRKQSGRADKILKNILSANPKYVPAMRLLAKTRLSLGDWIGAQQVADQIKQVGDKSNTSAQIKNAILIGKKDYDESISLLKRSYESTPSSIQPVVALVRTYLLAGKKKEAADFLAAVVKASPDNINARILQGQVYASQGLVDKAIAHYQKTLLLAPKNVSLHYNLVSALVRQRRYNDAKVLLDKGLAIAPNNFLLRLTSASIYEQIGQIDNAIAVYEDLIKERPGADVIANNLSSLLTETRSDKESLDKAYNLALRFKRSEVPQFKDTFGWASYRVGKYTDAVSLLESAAEALPQLAIVQYHLGMSYLAKEDKKKARQALEKALTLAGDRTFAQADEIRATLEKL